jgi:hypothetical protein
MVRTGYGRGELEYTAHRWSRRPDIVADHALEAVDRILHSAGGGG